MGVLGSELRGLDGFGFTSLSLGWVVWAHHPLFNNPGSNIRVWVVVSWLTNLFPPMAYFSL